MQTAVLRSPSTIRGKELLGLVVSGLAAPLCSALCCHAATKKKKEGKERKGKRKRKRNEK